MRVLVSADLEGVSGVTHPDQINPEGRYYKETLMRWIKEINAVVDGLYEAGVRNMIVADSHNHMRNLDNALISKASVITGWQRTYSMMAQIDKGIDACLFIGYHAMAGSRAVLSHTYRSKIIKSVKLNKMDVGEIGLNATLAGYYNVPIIMVSGDEETCIEAQALLGNQIIAIQTKMSLSRYSALSFSFDQNVKNLKQGAIKAIHEKTNWKPYKLPSPYTINVTFAEPNHADAAELIPGVKRISPIEVEYTERLYPIVFKCFLAMGALAASRDV